MPQFYVTIVRTNRGGTEERFTADETAAQTDMAVRQALARIPAPGSAVVTYRIDVCPLVTMPMRRIMVKVGGATVYDGVDLPVEVSRQS